MAKPRVFVSSTYYDLKHLRASLDIFIESLGFETILSEKGDIAYSPEIPLDESCYREAENSDLLVIIIGGRYGSKASSEKKELSEKQFYDRYDSITKKEVESAIRKDIPIYILIEYSVYSEYQTYSKNKDNKDIIYAHVDSVNIFELISSIISMPKNNPVKTFEKFSEIEGWLRDQWSGLFREFLQQSKQQKDLAALNAQIRSLADINGTLKIYLETIIRAVEPDRSENVIESESKRLAERDVINRLSENGFSSYLKDIHNISTKEFFEVLKESSTLDKLSKKIISHLKENGEGDEDDYSRIKRYIFEASAPRRDIFSAFLTAGLTPPKELASDFSDT